MVAKVSPTSLSDAEMSQWKACFILRLNQRPLTGQHGMIHPGYSRAQPSTGL